MDNFSRYSVFLDADPARGLAWLIVITGLPLNFFLFVYIAISEYRAFKFSRNRRDVDRQHFRNPSLWLLFNLLICDFIGCVYILILLFSDSYYTSYYQMIYRHPTNTSYLFIPNQWFKSMTCNIAQFLSKINLIMASSLTLCIAIDRFIMIVYPYSLKKFTLKRTKVITSILWIAALILSAGIVAYNAIAKKDRSPYTFIYTLNLCLGQFYSKSLYLFLGVLELVYYLGAYTITMVLYIKMIYKLRKTRLAASSQLSSIFEKRLQVMLTFISLTNVFAFCFIATTAIIDKASNVQKPSQFRKLISVFAFSNVAVDPLLYFIFRNNDITTLLCPCNSSRRKSIVIVPINSASRSDESQNINPIRSEIINN